MSVTGSATSTNLNCLKGKIRSLAPYAVDPTLAVEGAAADAKAAGDAISKKANAADIVDNLTTDDAKKMLSAKQGKVLKQSIDDFKSEINLETQNAKETATSAQSKANSAQQTADTANTAAEEANAAAEAAQGTADNALPKAGGEMTGNIAMGGFKITGHGEASEDTDLVNKKYVDGKRKTFTATLTVGGWSTEAPFVQSVVIDGILESDQPHIFPVYSETLEDAIAQREAWSKVCDAETGENTITFACFEEIPEKEIPIQIEVNR